MYYSLHIILDDSMCFSAGQSKQTFCVFCICERCACCLFWDLEKLYSPSHETADASRDYWRDKKKGTLSKTGNE